MCPCLQKLWRQKHQFFLMAFNPHEKAKQSNFEGRLWPSTVHHFWIWRHFRNLYQSCFFTDAQYRENIQPLVSSDIINSPPRLLSLEHCLFVDECVQLLLLLGVTLVGRRLHVLQLGLLSAVRALLSLHAHFNHKAQQGTETLSTCRTNLEKNLYHLK